MESDKFLKIAMMDGLLRAVSRIVQEVRTDLNAQEGMKVMLTFALRDDHYLLFAGTAKKRQERGVMTGLMMEGGAALGAEGQLTATIAREEVPLRPLIATTPAEME